jgi:hypothetical protein
MNNPGVWMVICFLGFALATGSKAARGNPKEAEKEKQILALVGQLGDDDFDRRETAFKALTQVGEDVFPVLDKLGPQADPEIQNRLRLLRRKLTESGDELHQLLSEAPGLVGESRQPLSTELGRLIKSHQPKATNYLLSIIADRDDGLNRRATNAFLQTWNETSVEQAETYFRRSFELSVKARKHYPIGADASIQMAYAVRYGWGGWPVEAKVQFDTRTSHFLDGKAMGEPFAYQGPMACTGWVRTKDLRLGKHTLSLVVDYEFSHRGAKHKGRLRSEEFSFEITDAEAPDGLAAARTPEDDAAVRDGFRMAETEERITGKGSDPRTSQITWSSPSGGAGGLHVPVWKVSAGLPVDLCFDVEMRVVKTGETIPCDALFLRRGEAGQGYFIPRLPQDFAYGRSGLIPVKIILKPSRGLALTYPEVKHYYSGGITSDVLQVMVSGE